MGISFHIVQPVCYSSPQYRFAMSTLDILAHYMAISHEEIIAIIQYIDSPANGIAMQSDYHDFFDDFDLCLIPADVRLLSFLYANVGNNERTCSKTTYIQLNSTSTRSLLAFLP